MVDENILLLLQKDVCLFMDEIEIFYGNSWLQDFYA